MNLFYGLAVQGQITNVNDLVNAINNGSPNAEILIGEGTFELTQPLRPKAGMTIKGAGKAKTIIMGAASWDPGTSDLPDGEVNWNTRNRNAYLFDLGEGVEEVTISDLTLKGPKLHGAVLGLLCHGLELYNLHLENFQWSSIRTFIMERAKIHDNTFVDAGGTHNGISGGALFLTYTKNAEVWNNEISYSRCSPKHFYGIKGREARYSRFHHNTIKVDFSIELPFESDYFVEIDHNYLAGVISIPKYAGGDVPSGGYTFHIHHNYFTTSYALEWPKNGVEVDHNLFDFDVHADYGNLISNFSWEASAGGPTKFHNNLIKNPGLGIMWNAGIYNNFSFYNNHVIANKTITPRTEGFFDFPVGTDFSTITIRDNIIESIGLARPLMRNEASYSAIIENNKLTNVSDAQQYANPQTGAKQGPLENLNFTLGANNKYTVNGWEISGGNNNPPPTPLTGQTIFTTQTPRGFGDEAQYELGTRFKTTVAGAITKVRLYTNGAELCDHIVRVWRVSDASIVAGPYTWSVNGGRAGWKEFTLPSPLTIAANTDYIVSISNSSRNKSYAYDTNGFASGITNGNLVTYAKSGVFSTTLGTMPTQTYLNSNYFRDVVFVAGSSNSGTGLTATYYGNKDFTGTTVTRIDSAVNFDWGTGSPAAGLGADQFSVRWQGQVEAPVTGEYVFSTRSDDGIRLWINGIQVINNWTDHAPTTNSSSAISLTAGTKYDLRLEYYENRGGSVAKLMWSYPTQSSQIIPQQRLYPTSSSLAFQPLIGLELRKAIAGIN